MDLYDFDTTALVAELDRRRGPRRLDPEGFEILHRAIDRSVASRDMTEERAEQIRRLAEEVRPSILLMECFAEFTPPACNPAPEKMLTPEQYAAAIAARNAGSDVHAIALASYREDPANLTRFAESVFELLDDPSEELVARIAIAAGLEAGLSEEQAARAVAPALLRMRRRRVA